MSVENSANALYFFALGLPAFALIKVFSSYIFARQNTKTPFLFSIYSVIINIVISILFFSEIGFIIIPIATTISSWLNALMLLNFLLKKKYISFDKIFYRSIFKIIVISFTSSLIFFQLINYFSYLLVYESEYKLITIITLVAVTLAIYMLISIFTKAFKTSDIKLKY